MRIGSAKWRQAKRPRSGPTKGASIHVHANASANAAAAAKTSTDPSVPNFSADMNSLTGPRADVQKRLADPERMPFEPVLDGQLADTVQG